MRPDDAKRLRWFAYLEWKLGNRRAAIDALQRAIQADPSFLDAYGRLSREQLRLGQWRAALRTINALVEQPNYDAARYSLDYRRVVVCIVLPLVAVVSLVFAIRRLMGSDKD